MAQSNGNGGSRNENVIVLPANERENPRFVHTVRQEDLVELQHLSRLFTEAREAWEEKKEWIKAALRAGARVEDGLRSAELVPRHREGYQVEPSEFYELVVR